MSYEPALKPVKWWTLRHGGWVHYLESLDWLVVGGESGPRHRPCDPAWIADIVRQCKAAGVPCFVKQASASRPGQQGQIPNALWAVKEVPCP